MQRRECQHRRQEPPVGRCHPQSVEHPVEHLLRKRDPAFGGVDDAGIPLDRRVEDADDLLFVDVRGDIEYGPRQIGVRLQVAFRHGLPGQRRARKHTHPGEEYRKELAPGQAVPCEADRFGTTVHGLAGAAQHEEPHAGEARRRDPLVGGLDLGGGEAFTIVAEHRVAGRFRGDHHRIETRALHQRQQFRRHIQRVEAHGGKAGLDLAADDSLADGDGVRGRDVECRIDELKCPGAGLAPAPHGVQHAFDFVGHLGRFPQAAAVAFNQRIRAVTASHRAAALGLDRPGGPLALVRAPLHPILHPRVPEPAQAAGRVAPYDAALAPAQPRDVVDRGVPLQRRHQLRKCLLAFAHHRIIRPEDFQRASLEDRNRRTSQHQGHRLAVPSHRCLADHLHLGQQFLAGGFKALQDDIVEVADRETHQLRREGPEGIRQLPQQVPRECQIQHPYLMPGVARGRCHVTHADRGGRGHLATLVRIDQKNAHRRMRRGGWRGPRSNYPHRRHRSK